MDRYDVLGLMSGTSLDGVDIAFCHIEKNELSWTYQIYHAETIEYAPEQREILSAICQSSALSFVIEHKAYGEYLGTIVDDFCKRHNCKPDFIASHGHTIFHDPDNGITFQLGDGQALSCKTGLPVISDFRSKDVLLGGQGAPLVPIGDMLLFKEYAYCLNIGGFSNISFEQNNERIAFDVTPANIILNELSRRSGYLFDNEGKLAASGKTNLGLLKALNDIDYYSLHNPKSLSREWVENVFKPVLDHFEDSVENLLNTVTEHIAWQISSVVNKFSGSSNDQMLVTGGGAKNAYLIQLIEKHAKTRIVVPDSQVVDFKEALIFALLGVLKWRNEINCLKSVTGATRDSCCGIIHMP